MQFCLRAAKNVCVFAKISKYFNSSSSNATTNYRWSWTKLWTSHRKNIKRASICTNHAIHRKQESLAQPHIHKRNHFLCLQNFVIYQIVRPRSHYIFQMYPEFIQLCTEFSALSIYQFLPLHRAGKKSYLVCIVVYIESCVEYVNRVWGSPTKMLPTHTNWTDDRDKNDKMR